MSNKPHRNSYWLAVALLVSFFPAGCLFFGHKKKTPVDTSANVAPDKVLYDRAVDDYKHGRYIEARLSLQTLINSYPESEYLAKAKLAVADSYYKEGGIDGLTQAVQEYKDFITFFPFLDEASYAQMQVAMSHYRMMEKADRDPTEARLAEQEFQTFLLKYPKSPLYPQAEQRLRDVQEVLGGADFDVARFYYIKGDYRASMARLIEVSSRYPLFSEADRTLWMMGDIYRRAAAGSKNEQQRAFWRSQADNQYEHLVKEYPLSSLANEAKSRLTADGVKPPAPDAQALARAEYEQKLGHKGPGILHRAMGMLKSNPDVSRAARVGEPDLNPPGEASSPQSILAENSGGTTSTGNSVGSNVSVQNVSPGDATAPPSANGPATSSDTKTSPTMGSAPPTSSGLPAAGVAYPPQDVTPAKSTTAAAPDPAAASESPASASSTAKSNGKKLDKHKESTSKKKKGLRKLIPW